MKKNKLVKLTPSLLALFLVVGCSGESQEAKNLGFNSVDEMKEIHKKGWHTKDKFEKDLQQTLEIGQADLKAGNTSDAAKKITYAAENGLVKAQSILGNMYANGVGVTKDLEKSTEWHTKAANSGDANSQYHLSGNYFSGLGVEQSYKKSFDLAQKAANQNHSAGQLAVGMHYEGGTGVDKDMKKAAEWYKKSAEAGNPTAMFRLGRLYSIGEGVEKDDKKGLELIELAAKNGDSDAASFIRSLRKSSYKNMVACLHPYAPGLAATLATNLMQFAADNSHAFGVAMTSSTYAQYCQIAYGVPGDENIQMAKRVAESGNNIYWVADRGQAAVGFIEQK